MRVNSDYESSIALAYHDSKQLQHYNRFNRLNKVYQKARMKIAQEEAAAIREARSFHRYERREAKSAMLKIKTTSYFLQRKGRFVTLSGRERFCLPSCPSTVKAVRWLMEMRLLESNKGAHLSILASTTNVAQAVYVDDVMWPNHLTKKIYSTAIAQANTDNRIRTWMHLLTEISLQYAEDPELRQSQLSNYVDKLQEFLKLHLMGTGDHYEPLRLTDDDMDSLFLPMLLPPLKAKDEIPFLDTVFETGDPMDRKSKFEAASLNMLYKILRRSRDSELDKKSRLSLIDFVWGKMLSDEHFFAAHSSVTISTIVIVFFQLVTIAMRVRGTSSPLTEVLVNCHALKCQGLRDNNPEPCLDVDLSNVNLFNLDHLLAIVHAVVHLIGRNGYHNDLRQQRRLDKAINLDFLSLVSKLLRAGDGHLSQPAVLQAAAEVTTLGANISTLLRIKSMKLQLGPRRNDAVIITYLGCSTQHLFLIDDGVITKAVTDINPHVIFDIVRSSKAQLVYLVVGVEHQIIDDLLPTIPVAVAPSSAVVKCLARYVAAPLPLKPRAVFICLDVAFRHETTTCSESFKASFPNWETDLFGVDSRCFSGLKDDDNIYVVYIASHTLRINGKYFLGAQVDSEANPMIELSSLAFAVRKGPRRLLYVNSCGDDDAESLKFVRECENLIPSFSTVICAMRRVQTDVASRIATLFFASLKPTRVIAEVLHEAKWESNAISCVAMDEVTSLRTFVCLGHAGGVDGGAPVPTISLAQRVAIGAEDFSCRYRYAFHFSFGEILHYGFLFAVVPVAYGWWTDELKKPPPSDRTFDWSAIEVAKGLKSKDFADQWYRSIISRVTTVTTKENKCLKALNGKPAKEAELAVRVGHFESCTTKLFCKLVPPNWTSEDWLHVLAGIPYESSRCATDRQGVIIVYIRPFSRYRTEPDCREADDGFYKALNVVLEYYGDAIQTMIVLGDKMIREKVKNEYEVKHEDHSRLNLEQQVKLHADIVVNNNVIVAFGVQTGALDLYTVFGVRVVRYGWSHDFEDLIAGGANICLEQKRAEILENCQNMDDETKKYQDFLKATSGLTQTPTPTNVSRFGGLWTRAMLPLARRRTDLFSYAVGKPTFWIDNLGMITCADPERSKKRPLLISVSYADAVMGEMERAKREMEKANK